MKRSELFELLIRALGVSQVVYGLVMAPSAISTLVQIPHESFLLSALVSSLGYSIVSIGAGVALFFGAEWFARKVYPD